MNKTLLRITFVGMVVTAAIGASPGVARADSFIFTTLSLPGVPTDFNNALQFLIAGRIWQNGVFSAPFSVPGATVTNAYAINDLGHVAGTAGFPVAEYRRGFQYVLGFGYTVYNFEAFIDIWDINNNDVMVGMDCCHFGGNIDGFRLQPSGAVSFIDLPGFFSSRSLRINDSGAILGFAQFPIQPPFGATLQWYLYQNGVFNWLNVAADTYLQDINNAGQIVGNSSLGAFLLMNGMSQPIVFPGSTSTRAIALNNNGQILGSFTDATGGNYFLATPIPEPTSVLLVGVGLAVIGRRLRSRGVARNGGSRRASTRFVGSPK